MNTTQSDNGLHCRRAIRWDTRDTRANGLLTVARMTMTVRNNDNELMIYLRKATNVFFRFTPSFFRSVMQSCNHRGRRLLRFLIERDRVIGTHPLSTYFVESVQFSRRSWVFFSRRGEKERGQLVANAFDEKERNFAFSSRGKEWFYACIKNACGILFSVYDFPTIRDYFHGYYCSVSSCSSSDGNWETGYGYRIWFCVKVEFSNDAVC